MVNNIPLNIVVVGHTNTGKTSLLRTLTRDTSFGEVDNAPGTTRQVAGATQWLNDKMALVWFDTPGLEDSVALRDWVETPETLSPADQNPQHARLDGPQKIQRFLNSSLAHNRFEQEARVLDKVLASDAALYVIDARDPVLAKHRDELALLVACAKPIIAVLNFTAKSIDNPFSNIDAWIDILARNGLHVYVWFDTVSPALDAERHLFEALAQVLPKHKSLFVDLVAQTAAARLVRRNRAYELIADLIVDVASWRLPTPSDESALKEAQHIQQSRIRAREQKCLNALLITYSFNKHDVLSMPLTLVQGRWETDLFAPEALREVGFELSKGAAAGALAGAAVDVMTGGLSLGTGTLVGAAAGAGWQGLEKWGGRLLGQIKGHRELTVDDTILKLLCLRQLQLLYALEQRGHAAIEPMHLSVPDLNASTHTIKMTGSQPERQHSVIDSKAFKKTIRLARQHPDWSTLKGVVSTPQARDRAVGMLSQAMQSEII